MNEYIASEEDFKAIREGIATVWNPKLNYIFKDKKLFKNLSVISYDSNFIYLWTENKFLKLEKINFNFQNFISYRISHNIELTTDDRLGWMAGLQNEKIIQLLPKKINKDRFRTPLISGSLLGDFIALQKKIKGEKNNPYITRESYLATIVHEFAHAYYDQHKLWYFSDKQSNIKLLKKALSFYSSSGINNKVSINLPSPYFLSEVFAFCTDYSAAKIFWPDHKKDIDQSNIIKIKGWINKEKHTNLDKEDSVLSERYPHNIASVLGIILIQHYPKTWPKKFISKTNT